MMTSGTTRVCGIFGYPVKHTMSPLMHNYFAEMTGVDLTYVAFETRPELLKEGVSGAYAMNILGANVTVPHKQAVMEFLTEMDEGAKTIGAVNTLVRTEQGFKGYNTDAEGLYRAMKKNGVKICGRTCILIGAGGAAKAAAYILAREGAEKIYCLNRSVEKAEALASSINRVFGKTVMQAEALENWKNISEKGCLAVQTTSVGMHPNVNASPITDPGFFEKLSDAVDVIYTPAVTRFMQLAENAGARAINGLDMLIYQGVSAFELWNPEVLVSEEAIEGVRVRILKYLEEKA